jgi:hypothetical protein
MRVFCLLFIKGKRKSEAQVLKFPAGEFVTLWAHPHTCTEYPYKIELENAMQDAAILSGTVSTNLDRKINGCNFSI